MRHTVILGLILAGCAGAPTREPGPVPDSLHCTVKRIALEGEWENPLLIHFEARFREGKNVLSAPALTLIPGQWGTIMITEHSGQVTWGWRDEGPCLDEEHSPESGTFLVVRCQDAGDDRIDADIRAYYAEGGKITWTTEVKETFSDGEERTF